MGLGRKWGLSPLTVTALLVAVAGPDSMLYFFGGMAPRSADAAAGGAADRLSGENISNSVELDLQNLPLVVPEKEVKPNFPSQPQECAFSSKDGEKTSIRLTLTPAQGASFRCPGDSDLVQPPTHDEHAFRLASDGSCDTSKVFPFPGLLIENSPANQGVSHKRLSVPGWSLVEEKKACYVCRGKTGENAGKTCTVVVSVPPAPHLTSKQAFDCQGFGWGRPLIRRASPSCTGSLEGEIHPACGGSGLGPVEVNSPYLESTLRWTALGAHGRQPIQGASASERARIGLPSYREGYGLCRCSDGGVRSACSCGVPCLFAWSYQVVLQPTDFVRVRWQRQ